ncbi:thrombospondin type 3 repeat-containing protein [Patescibacteria group bacterium]|nr:thrombospondin type 3 repeat-containing protein [Patescibacteria group bacterium]
MKRLLLLTLILLPRTVLAQEFAYERTINIPNVQKEMSVWIPLDTHALQYRNSDFQIVNSKGEPQAFKRTDKTTNLLSKASIDQAPKSADTVPMTTIDQLADNNPATYYQPVTSTSHTFLFHFDEEVAPHNLVFQLQSGWIDHVKVRLGTERGNMKDAFVGAPKGTLIKLSGEKGRYFEITILTKEGVLQISEVSLLAPQTSLLMVAKPEEQYHLQYGTQDEVTNPSNENVYADANAITAELGSMMTIAGEGGDSDKDGIPNSLDNCPNAYNPDQRDRDSDSLGDQCDNAPLLPNTTQNDKDSDGVGDGQDNCPKHANSDQKDVDLDGIGWVCDDADSDGVINSTDNCVGLANRDQNDLNHNGIGDACEDDRDQDGVPRTEDNCSTTNNPDQSDQDKDGIGDACDVCPEHYDPKQIDRDGNGIGDVCQNKIEATLRDTDDDGISDIDDVCPKVTDPEQLDTDEDEIGDKCDNCPNLQNKDQRDRNNDGKGDVCTDTDGDGILDPYDNCAPFANDDQKDKDEDGIGDPCDDDDGDRIQNAVDNCPFDSNPYQGDEDNDGEGNPCDNTDNRWSEERPWILWVSMIAIILVLTGLGASLLRKTSP